jgi:F-type H+-transporting ATPase subunit epsilon
MNAQSNAEKIHFELVSPEEKLVSEPVALATIPGEEGEFGVGPGHTSIVANLKPGVVSLYAEKGGQPRRIFIAGGFADVTGAQCSVLAEEAVNVNDLNQAQLEQELKDLSEDLTLVKEQAEKTRIEKKLVLIKAKLQAVTGKIVF